MQSQKENRMPYDQKSLAASLRVRHVHVSGYRGQRNHDRRTGRIPGYVDQDRMVLNTVPLDPAEPRFMADTCRELANVKARKRALKAGSAVATVGVLSFGKGLQELVEGLSVDDQDAMCLAVGVAVQDRFGSVLRGCVVHRDETAIHAHLAFDSRAMVGTDSAGEPNSKRMRGSELQDLVCEVVQRFIPDAERGIRKEVRRDRGDPRSAWVHRSVAELHNDLPAEIEAARRALEELTERVCVLRGRVAKLEDREALSEREFKRLDVYRKRLESQELELARKADALGKSDDLKPENPFA